MIIFWIVLFITVAEAQRRGVTPHLLGVEEMKNVAAFDDAQHRGPRWYDYRTDSETGSKLSSSDGLEPQSSSSSSDSLSSDMSGSASSKETSDDDKLDRVYRKCTPCPSDMLKKHSNIGIKWICGGYQRARRSFKSACMMRYRNCEDGTMFVKLYSKRCNNDTYHGRHWFYMYKV